MRQRWRYRRWFAARVGRTVYTRENLPGGIEREPGGWVVVRNGRDYTLGGVPWVRPRRGTQVVAVNHAVAVIRDGAVTTTYREGSR